MLKKLALTSIALIVSSSIAFADTPVDTTTTTTTTTDTSAAMDAPQATVVPKPHKKHYSKKHRHHKKHHYHQRAPENTAMPAASEPASDPAPMGGYKGEVAPAACPACEHVNFNTGAYVGLGVGSRINYLSVPAAFTAVEGNLFAGYSALWDQMYGAIEIFVQDDAEIHNYRSRTRGSIATSWGYGLSVIPGYLITDNVLGYLRLGVVNTHFTNNSRNATGGQVGLGLETALTNSWDLRGEWVYSSYNSVSNGVPRSQQFNLGLLYKFQV